MILLPPGGRARAAEGLEHAPGTQNKCSAVDGVEGRAAVVREGSLPPGGDGACIYWSYGEWASVSSEWENTVMGWRTQIGIVYTIRE